MEKPIRIRAATIADAPAISELNAEVQALHAEALPWRFKPANASSFPEYELETILADSNSRIMLAEKDTAALGYVWAEFRFRPEGARMPSLNMVYVHHIGVRASARGKGVGTALMSEVKTLAKSKDIDLIGLDMWSFNDQERAFFKAQGFNLFNEVMYNRS